MENVNPSRAPMDHILTCCLCKERLKESVLLICLHNCCKACFKKAISKSTGEELACGECGKVTRRGSEQRNEVIDNQVWRDRIKDGPKVCDCCNKECVGTVVECCGSCRHFYCLTCKEWHSKFHPDHRTVSLELSRNLEEVNQHCLATCTRHGWPLEYACINCKQLECRSFRKKCEDKEHVVHDLSNGSFDVYVEHLSASLYSLEKQCSSKSKEIVEPGNILSSLKEARADHLEEIERRKHRIVNAVESACRDIPCSTDAIYAGLQKRVEDAADVVGRTKANFAYAQSYFHELLNSSSKFGIFDQYEIVRRRLKTVLNEFDAVKDTFGTTVVLGSSMPEDLEHTVRSWIGTPILNATPRLPHRSFGAPSASLKLRFDCCDVALTNDRSLLLAAEQYGLYEYSLAGRQLSFWQPPKLSDGRYDSVQAVAALSDGRAAVSLYRGQLVVLLRRRKNCDSGGTVDAWAVDRRFDQLMWCPGLLSVYGDVIAVGECRNGNRLRLGSTCNGQWVNPELGRKYRIRSLAIAKQMLITASTDELELNGEHRACVLDAHQLAVGDELKWRLELCVWDVCTESTGNIIYAAVCQSNENGGRVAAFCVQTGSELKRIVLSFDGRLMLPRRLSFKEEEVETQSGTSSCCILSVLCCDIKTLCACDINAMCACDSNTVQWRTVTTYFSTDR